MQLVTLYHWFDLILFIWIPTWDSLYVEEDFTAMITCGNGCWHHIIYCQYNHCIRRPLGGAHNIESCINRILGVLYNFSVFFKNMAVNHTLYEWQQFFRTLEQHCEQMTWVLHSVQVYHCSNNATNTVMELFGQLVSLFVLSRFPFRVTKLMKAIIFYSHYQYLNVRGYLNAPRGDKLTLLPTGGLHNS